MANIVATLQDGFQVNVSNGRHTWHADEPTSSGGADTGPTPYELLLGALGACTCITLQLYARHKGIELRSVAASYEFARVHADDCAECEEEGSGLIEKVNSRIHIEGDLTDAQRERLTQVAERCPVHKTLAGGVRIFDEVTFS